MLIGKVSRPVAQVVRAIGSPDIEGVAVPIYDPAKSIVNCFKYRSRVGLDVAIEALRDGLRHRKASHADLRRYATICRVENIMRPYLESLS